MLMSMSQLFLQTWQVNTKQLDRICRRSQVVIGVLGAVPFTQITQQSDDLPHTETLLQSFRYSTAATVQLHLKSSAVGAKSAHQEAKLPRASECASPIS